MSSTTAPLSTYKLGATSANIPPHLPANPLSSSWKSFVRKLRQQRPVEFITITAMISSKTTTSEMPAVLMDENLSAEDREAREKGLQLVACLEHLAQTDEGFRRWLQVGFDQVASGQVVIFGEGGWYADL